jgi:sec-independent protein translocase protein TatB
MLSVPHLIVIFIVALVVFGPEKIPELARNLGKIMAEFRRVTGDLRSTFEGHLRDLEREADQRRSTAAVAGPAAVSPVPAHTSVPAADAGAVAPGTVPSNPPNAAAVRGPNPTPPSAPDSAPKANSGIAYTQPGDPMHDPYLMSMDFPEQESEAANANKPSEPAQESERVTDGDGRNS